MENAKVRKKMIDSNIKSYEVAKAIGIAPETFSKWLRYKLTKEKELLIMSAIENLKNGEIK